MIEDTGLAGGDGALGGVEADGGAAIVPGLDGGGGAGVVVANAGGGLDGFGEFGEGNPVAAFDFKGAALEIFDRADDDAVFLGV